MLEESESLLDMMQDDYNFSTLSTSHMISSQGLWDHDTSDGTDTDLPLPLPFSVEIPQTDILKEDFQKMLSDWQEHLGTLQASDSEDMDVKDMVEMDMRMPKNIPVEIPTDIFEDSPSEMKSALSVGKMHLTPKDRIFNGLSLNFSENLNTFNLENFLEDDDEEEHKFGLIVAEEEESAGGINVGLAEREQLTETTEGSEITTISDVSNDGSAAAGKGETEEESVDVETVVDQIPVLEAGDLKSLLEQFEASEAFNCGVSSSPAGSTATEKVAARSEIPSSATQTISPPKRRLVPILSPSTVAPAPTASPIFTSISASTNTAVEAGITLHESIRDSLPQEVIDRIKASNRRKAIPVIPAMPSRRPGRGATRMQVAAATLSRNKLLKLVSGGGKGGESIQLDHDYCSSVASPTAEVPPPKSFYHSNASEYASEQNQQSPCSSKDSEDSTSCAKSVLGDNKVYSRLPEYYVVLAPQKTFEKGRKGTVKEEVWDKNSRKDSGLESGEVSDASEETIGTPVATGSRDIVSSSNSVVRSEDRKCVKTIVPPSVEKGVVAVDVQNKYDLPDRKKTMSVLRSDGSQSVLKDWSTLRQDSVSNKPVAMVSVLKKNNVGCTTNITNRQQSLLISSNSNSNNSSSTISSNSVSTNTTCSTSNIHNSSSSSSSNSSSSSQVVMEAEKIKSEGPKKRKLNLEEYRSRLKELDRSRVKEETCKLSPLPIMSSIVNTAKDHESTETKEQKEDVDAKAKSAVNNDAAKVQRPVMHSVEVQTQTSIFDEVPEENGSAKERRSRKKQRKYCSKRASSSSSSHSTSSSGSRRHRRSRSQVRRKTSRRRTNGGHSVSSSGSQRPCSRSRSNSSRSSSSYSSYSSRSRSRSRSRSSARRSPSCGRPGSSHSYQNRYCPRRPMPYSNGWRSRSRSPPLGPRKNEWMLTDREKQRQVEERRVIYVGRIDEGTSKAELRRRFEPFGPIIDISVHFREHGDNYGFVTFLYKVDAYEAVEHGNDDPNLPRYDLCFGGRRAFCKTRYADLDGLATSAGSFTSSTGYSRPKGFCRRIDAQAEDFDILLREAQAKLRKRKV